MSQPEFPPFHPNPVWTSNGYKEDLGLSLNTLTSSIPIRTLSKVVLLQKKIEQREQLRRNEFDHCGPGIGKKQALLSSRCLTTPKRQ
jgi:hypothetical protein